MATFTNASPNETVAILVPFQISGNGGVAKAIGEHDVLKQQLIGMLMTNHGERIMLPNFGADVQSKVFEPTNELETNTSADEILSALRGISTLLKVSSVSFQQDPNDPASVFLIVNYSVNNNTALLKVKLINGIITDEDPLL